MASYEEATSNPARLPLLVGHHIQDQHVGGNARVHNGDVINTRMTIGICSFLLPIAAYILCFVITSTFSGYSDRDFQFAYNYRPINIAHAGMLGST